jgi:hypothetical protein
MLWNPKVQYRIHKSHPHCLYPESGLPSAYYPDRLRRSSFVLYLTKLISVRFSSLLQPLLRVLDISSSLTSSFHLYLTKTTTYESPYYASLSFGCYCYWHNPTAVIRRSRQESNSSVVICCKILILVKGKNMVRTRSSTHNEEIQPSLNTKPSRGNVVKKAVRSMNIMQKKIKSATKPNLLTR